MTLSELPDIEINKSIRSKRLRLRIDGTSIRVTAPWFCTHKQIQQFVQDSEAWIVQTWQAQQSKIQQIDRVLPLSLQLFNLENSIQIQYIQQKLNYKFDSVMNELSVSDRQPQQYLKAFVIDYAKQHLPVYLAQVSDQCGLAYHGCKIRQPKTRWGSCTARHDIMLNSALVLFPQEITRYVCVHELAHTKHFDHSAQFWAEVAKYDPDFKLNRKKLKITPLPYWWMHN